MSQRNGTVIPTPPLPTLWKITLNNQNTAPFRSSLICLVAMAAPIPVSARAEQRNDRPINLSFIAEDRGTIAAISSMMTTDIGSKTVP